MVIRQATDQDWETLQGGKPLVEKEGSLFKITHNYPKGEGMQITRHKPIDPDDTIRFSINKDVVEFPSALVRSLEGEPCEKRSLSVGGERYHRVNIER